MLAGCIRLLLALRMLGVNHMAFSQDTDYTKPLIIVASASCGLAFRIKLVSIIIITYALSKLL
jgi:hypothetical protein